MEIFLVAAHGALQQSIAFLLESEGLVVCPCLSLAAAEEAFRQTNRAACVVIDADALPDRAALEPAMREFGSALVLIVEQGAARVANAVTCLQKPLLGAALTQAVRRILGADAAVAPAT